MSKQKTTPKDKTVTFLLPFGGTVPVGGLKVVYEYANALANRGWGVRVVHPHTVGHEEIEEAVRASVFRRSRRWLGFQRCRITENYRPDQWFKVGSNVELLYTKTLAALDMPPSDAWVATAWRTAKWAANRPGARLYLIQHLETWDGPEADVMATWKLPRRKVVISRWLEDVAGSLGEPAEYIPNGLDFTAFGMDVASEKRDPHTVAMLYNGLEWKGSMDGIATLCKVKDIVPTLRACVFGVYPRPSDLPTWVEYHQNPPQSKLREAYNEAAIFISPSWVEGWPLPPAEAMQCGAALAATDIGGHREYAEHEKTALLSPPKDPGAMASSVLRLIQNRELRLRLARQGHNYVQSFTWNRAVTSFESVLSEALDRERGDGPNRS
jgi:glycosyltransferase involved in cell wall biosynthesis